MVESSGKGHDDADEGCNDGEDYRAEGVVGEGVEDFGAGEDVEPNEDYVVGEEHEGGEFVGDA